MIITAQTYHLKDIVKLWQKYYDESPYTTTHKFEPNTTLDWMRRAMIYPHAQVAVAEWDSKTVGFSVCYLNEYAWTSGTKAVMEFLYVDPEYRAQGLAEGLISHQIAWAQKNNAQELIGGDLGIRPRLTQRFLEDQDFCDPGVILRKILINES